MRASLPTVVLLALVAGAAWPATDAELAEREAELLEQVKAENADDPLRLWELARVREQRGRYQSAIDTWGLLRRWHGWMRMPHESSAPDQTFLALAEFWIHRLHRKQRLAAHPPSPPSRHERQVMGQAARGADSPCLGEREGTIEHLVEADLDGDRVPELVAVGRYDPIEQPGQRFICLLRWDGAAWSRFAEWDETDLAQFPSTVRVIDTDGDAWLEIVTGFASEGNIATIYANGETAIWTR